jgi:hypothetical protein
MSTTEWKFVPVEPTREMLVAALKTNGACPIYAAMLDAAPVPPSVESLLENWTPSDQQAFAKFRDEHFPGEMSSYAIQSLGSAWKDGQANAQPKPAHLTIPGALEWDGDNGTHGVVGTHSADGEHSESAAAIATLKALGYTHNGGTHWKPPVGQKPDFDLIDSLRAQLDNTEQSRRSFFDLSQDLEKRLGKVTAFVQSLCDAAGSQPSVATGYLRDILDALSASAEPATDHSVDATEKAKPKICIECDQPYCHGVCVERGDQDYDRDQAAKGGDDE